ncbi:hypothetical protein BD408DRAFT_194552 [Parasitella parasitica]|nr:hypothetical protein BD408DRAFT_194552 [Parasitella parasitica]
MNHGHLSSSAAGGAASAAVGGGGGGGGGGSGSGSGPSTIAGEFNPYNDSAPTSGSLKSSQSLPEPMLEGHFNTGRSSFHPQQQQTSPNSFHLSQQPTFSQLNLGTYRQSNPGGGFVSRNTPPSHDQFFTNNEEINGMLMHL